MNTMEWIKSLLAGLVGGADGYVATFRNGRLVPEANAGGTATAITVANEATDTTCFPTFVTAATGDLGPKTNAGLAFNSNTGLLTPTGVTNSVFSVVNGSGATAAANEIGYINSSGQYVTTTTAKLDANWCVVVVGGANGATIYVQVRGLATIKCTASNTAGDWLVTSTTAGQAATNGADPHYAMFAKVITANGSGAGGTCTALLYCHTKPVAATNANTIYRVIDQSDTLFVATINGAPGATSVVYNAPSSGNENCINVTASTLGQMVLWNSTRSTGRLITAVNTGTNTITTVSSTDAWANGDTITIESTTVTSGAAWKMVDIDLTQQTVIPASARTLLVGGIEQDTGGDGWQMYLHPLETYAASKIATFTSVGTIYMELGTRFIPLVSRRFCLGVDASGVGTSDVFVYLNGWLEAIP